MIDNLISFSEAVSQTIKEKNAYNVVYQVLSNTSAKAPYKCLILHWPT